jgi:hypothetical protein
MTPTTTPFSPDFAKELVPWMFSLFEEGTKQAYRMLWDIFLSFLKMHWGLSILFLFFVFTIATLKALTGRWGMLGSVLYNFFYFGTLFIVGLIWGPEVFAGDIFRAACTAILYPICFVLTGWILKKTGMRR